MGNVKVIKFCILCNEVGTGKCNCLPVIYQTIEVSKCCFALDIERGDFILHFRTREGESFCATCEQSLVCRRRLKMAVGVGCAVDVTLLKSLNM